MANWHLRPCKGRGDLFIDPGGLERASAKAERVNAAKALCRECPTHIECLAEALEHREPHDIWGGLTVEERAEILDELDRVRDEEPVRA